MLVVEKGSEGSEGNTPRLGREEGDIGGELDNKQGNYLELLAIKQQYLGPVSVWER